MFYVMTLTPWDEPLPDTKQLCLSHAAEQLTELLWRKSRTRRDHDLLLKPGRGARECLREALATTVGIYEGALTDGRSVNVFVTGVPCTACGYYGDTHVKGKCLYGPTHLSYDKDWLIPPGARYEGQVVLKYEGEE